MTRWIYQIESKNAKKIVSELSSRKPHQYCHLNAPLLIAACCITSYSRAQQRPTTANERPANHRNLSTVLWRWLKRRPAAETVTIATDWAQLGPIHLCRVENSRCDAVAVRPTVVIGRRRITGRIMNEEAAVTRRTSGILSFLLREMTEDLTGALACCIARPQFVRCH